MNNNKDINYAAFERGEEYYDYENYEIEVDNSLLDHHQVIQKIGRGKYSDVFKCINSKTNNFCVIKVLKPVRESKIKRQIKILKTINGINNVIGLHGVTYDQCTKTYCLIQPYVKNSDIRDLPDAQITLFRVQNYIKQILKALQGIHRAGIIHRDIKPQNVLYNKQTEQVFVGDWGLAEFYLPSRDYNVRVASRYYKGPELLLNNRYYGYSLDIWSLGCVLAGLIFLKSTFFRGDSNPDQMRAIMEYVGNQEVENYIKKYNLKPDKQVVKILQQHNYQKKPWTTFINSSNSRLATKQAINLVSKMLIIDHSQRITADQALNHPFFKQST